MHVASDYSEDIEALARRAEAEKLETLAFLLQMALDYVQCTADRTRRSSKIRGEYGKQPYAHPEVHVLFRRSGNES